MCLCDLLPFGLRTRLQVVFNLARLSGYLSSQDDAYSASGCTFTGCAAVTRVLLLLVPQFAVPGSRTTRNYERNAWMSSPSRTIRPASAAPPVRSGELGARACKLGVSGGLDSELPLELALDAWNRVDEQSAGGTEENSDSCPEPTTAEAAADERVLPKKTVHSKYRLHIRCNNLLDCDVFSKSDPYAIVMGGRNGQRPEDFVELGRTEVIEDNLNPVFETVVDVGSLPSDPQVTVRLKV